MFLPWFMLSKFNLLAGLGFKIVFTFVLEIVYHVLSIMVLKYNLKFENSLAKFLTPVLVTFK